MTFPPGISSPFASPRGPRPCGGSPREVAPGPCGGLVLCRHGARRWPLVGPRGTRIGVLVPGARPPPRSRPVAVGDGRGLKEWEVPSAYPFPDREAKAGWGVIRAVL